MKIKTDEITSVIKQEIEQFTSELEISEVGQDGGVVTGLLAWAFEANQIDGAIASTVGEKDKPCFPSPKVVTTQEEIKSSAGS